MPHLLCCISIDEIDSLVPKRDEKTSTHKIDALNLLLAVIGVKKIFYKYFKRKKKGIKDIKNVIILSATNRLL